jgi:hypothetical protein
MSGIAGPRGAAAPRRAAQRPPRAGAARVAAAGLAAFLLPLAWPSPARAGTEEFSTFDVALQEEDDESLLDHMLTRAPLAWRAEWERAGSAIRTSQGCLTSGQWFIHTDLKLRTALGKNAQFGLDIRQNQTDRSNYDYLDFSFRFPTGLGTFGAMFRPLYDKSKQDFGLTWEAGNDTSALQIQAAFIFEDTFNNLWEFRQTRVGNASEPYTRHPYEPNLRVAHRGEGAVRRLEAGGTWLTPSVKTIAALPVDLTRRLWGATGYGLAELAAAGALWELRGTNLQAASGTQPVDLSTSDGRTFRRQWAAEVAATRHLVGRIEGEARFMYQSRGERTREPVGPGRFDAIDRLLMLEARFPIAGEVQARVGGMFDRITVAHEGMAFFQTYGTRNESRAFVGLSARFGRVSIHAVEGIELDPEPYEVWLVHDKGFLHLQATF